MTARAGLFFVILAAALSAAPPAARADACLDELKALYRAEMDPFNRLPYRSVKTVFTPDGAEALIFDDIVENPLETISGTRGGPFGLVIDRKVWTGPTQQGPWTPSLMPPAFPADRKASYLAQQAQMLANMGDAVCHGEVELEAARFIHYEYSIHPPEGDTALPFWGAERNKIWIDPETRQAVRWEQTDFQVSFLPGINKERHVFVFDYDETIRVDPPE